MTEKIKQNQEGTFAEPQGDLLLLDLLHRINVREKIVKRPNEPEEEGRDD